MSVPVCVVVVLLMIGTAGCEKKSGEAVVLSKEHIDAAPPIKETPNAQSGTTPEAELRPMADDEIAVDEIGDAWHEPRSTCVKGRTVDRENANARERPHIPSPGRSSKMGEIARERPGQSQVSHGQIYRNCVGRRD
jgi:hypothetical protein